MDPHPTCRKDLQHTTTPALRIPEYKTVCFLELAIVKKMVDVHFTRSIVKRCFAGIRLDLAIRMFNY